MLRNKSIVCFSSIDWKDKQCTPTSKNHLMLLLSKQNKVVYIETVGYRPPRLSDIRRIFKRLFRHFRGSSKEDNPESLIIYSPLAIPYYKYKPIRFINQIWLKRQVKSLIKKHELKDIILWTYIATMSNVIGSFDEKCVIYHCVDEITEYSNLINAPKEAFIQMEDHLLKNCDVVFVTNPLLQKSKQKKANCPVYLVPNAVDIDHYEKALKSEKIPKDINDIKKPIIGYMGSLTEIMDFSLIDSLAKKHEEWSFVFVGPNLMVKTKLPKRPNIYYLGRRDYKEVPDYIKTFDVCLIPFKENKHLLYCCPTKLFEYMATGIPIVSTPMPAAEPFKELIYFAKDIDSYEIAIVKALAEKDENLKKRRIEEAEKNTWKARIEFMSDKIINVLEGK